jgi:hypothetical protein
MAAFGTMFLGICSVAGGNSNYYQEKFDHGGDDENVQNANEGLSSGYGYVLVLILSILLDIF